MKVLAFDFGASSGRAIIGTYEGGKLSLEEIHRFDNDPVKMNGGFYWDLPRLFHEIKQALIKAKAYDYDFIGIDTWGVDYALLSKDGLLLGNPYNYRDERTVPVFENLKKEIPESELYAMTGIQNMNINTLYQILETKQNHPELYAGATDNGALSFYYLAFRRGNDSYRRIGQTFAMLCSHDGDPVYHELGEALYCWFSSVVKKQIEELGL